MTVTLNGIRGLGVASSAQLQAGFNAALAAGDPLAVAAMAAAGNVAGMAAGGYLVSILNTSSTALTPSQAAYAALAYSNAPAATYMTDQVYGTPSSSPATGGSNPLLSQTNPVAGGTVATSASNPFSSALTTIETGNISGIPYWAIAIVGIGALYMMSKHGR